MLNYIQKGDILDFAVPAGNGVKSGDPITMGDLVGVASTDGAVGDIIAVAIAGVYELPKDSSTIAQGQKVYIANGSITTTATGTDENATANVLAGYAAAPAATAETTVRVKLIG